MAEKSLSELPRELRMLYTKGHDALQRDNFDYAIDLFNQVLAKAPAIYDCRKELRTAQMKKAAGGTGFFKKMLSSAHSQPLVFTPDTQDYYGIGTYKGKVFSAGKGI